MEKDMAIEIGKRKIADIYYRKRVCRCLMSKVISLARLVRGIPGTNLRYGRNRYESEGINRTAAMRRR